jgi:hypothetical protein
MKTMIKSMLNWYVESIQLSRTATARRIVDRKTWYI